MSSSETQQENENPFVAPDTTDDPPYETPEPEPFAPEEEEPPPRGVEPPGPTEKEIEAIYKRANKATATYVSKLEEIFESEWKHYHGCPLCEADFPGFVHEGRVGRFPREIISGVNEIMTGFKQVEYKQLPGFETCPTCDGEGKGFTGSKVPDKQYADCPTCKARGFIAPQVAEPNGHNAAGVIQFAAPDEAPYSSDADVDPWGEPRTLPDGRDNPNYGKMPNFKVSVEPYGNTAALTQQAGV